MQDSIAIITLCAYNIGDAYCDARFPCWRSPIKTKSWTKEQWIWHIVKWSTTYPIQFWLLWTNKFSLSQIGIIAVTAFVLWQAVYAFYNLSNNHFEI